MVSRVSCRVGGGEYRGTVEVLGKSHNALVIQDKQILTIYWSTLPINSHAILYS